MKEKWLIGYSDLAEETPTPQSEWSVVISLICALILTSLLWASTVCAAAPKNALIPPLPTPPEHIEPVEPAESLKALPATTKAEKAEDVLKAPPIIEPPMPVEVEKAVEEEKEAIPTPVEIPAAVSEKLSNLENKIHSLEVKQTLFENELKELRHQAAQPEEKDIQYSSAPIETAKVNVPSIEEISNDEEL